MLIRNIEIRRSLSWSILPGISLKFLRTLYIVTSYPSHLRSDLYNLSNSIFIIESIINSFLSVLISKIINLPYFHFLLSIIINQICFICKVPFIFCWRFPPVIRFPAYVTPNAKSRFCGDWLVLTISVV
jgi:hypothetical protein